MGLGAWLGVGSLRKLIRSANIYWVPACPRNCDWRDGYKDEQGKFQKCLESWNSALLTFVSWTQAIVIVLIHIINIIMIIIN